MKIDVDDFAWRLKYEMDMLARVNSQSPSESLRGACENVLRDLSLLDYMYSEQEYDDMEKGLREDAKEDFSDCTEDLKSTKDELRVAQDELKEIETERETLYRSLAEYERLYGRL